MTYKEFIDKASQGGFDFTEPLRYDQGRLLDPKVWQAVGRVEGWDVQMKDACICSNECTTDIWYSGGFCSKCGATRKPIEKWTTNYIKNMHRMIDALVEGKSIEQFLKTL